MASLPPADLAERYDVRETVDYIAQGGYRNVALQFPDDLLADSPSVYRLLQQQLGDRARVFILADTAYNPLGVDEVAAKHLAANCVIHYGRASLVPVSSLPAFFVFPKEPLAVRPAARHLLRAVQAAQRERCAAAATAAAAASGGRSNVSPAAGVAGAEGAAAAAGGAGACGGGGFGAVVLLVDQGYQHRLQDLAGALRAEEQQEEEEEGKAAGCGGEDSPPLPPLVFARVTARSLSPPAAHTPATAATAAPTAAAAGATAAPGCCSLPSGTGTGAGTHPAAECCAAGSQTAACCSSSNPAAASAQPPPPPPPPVQQQPQQQQPVAGEGSCCRTACKTAGSSSNSNSGCATGPAAGRCAGADNSSAGAGYSSSSSPSDPSSSSPTGSSSSSHPTDTCSMAGLTWSLPAGLSRSEALYVWVGPEGSSAQQVLQMTHNTCEWLSYDPVSSGTSSTAGDGGAGEEEEEGGEGAEGCVRRGLSDETRRLLRRRHFIVEKARAANIVGLLVGTLGSAGFLEVLSCLRRLAAAAGKKTYTFLLGKPNPAKLGNFPEVDVFVQVSEPQGLLLDCRDYLAPLATPWEAAAAWGGRHLDLGEYRLGLTDVLDLEQQLLREQKAAEKSAGPEDGETEQNGAEGDAGALQVLGGSLGGLSLATRGSGTALCAASSRHEVVAHSAAEYLTLKRTFKGLEMPATGAAPKAAHLAMEGLSGRAAAYQDEGRGE